MTLSAKTLSGNLGKEETIEVGTPTNATERLSTGEFSKNVKVTRTTPNTEVDMYNLEKWKKGDPEPKGTLAKSLPAWKRYRRDLESAPKEADYKAIYIDTTKPVGPQLKDLKG